MKPAKHSILLPAVITIALLASCRNEPEEPATGYLLGEIVGVSNIIPHKKLSTFCVQAQKLIYCRIIYSFMSSDFIVPYFNPLKDIEFDLISR